MINKLLALPLSIILIFSVSVSSAFTLSGCSGSEKPLVINDKNGIKIAEMKTSDAAESTAEKINLSYIDCAVKEAAELLRGRGFQKASDELIHGGYTIDTFLNPDMMTAIDKAYRDSDAKKLPFACSITDNKGGLQAVYSNEEKEFVNYASIGYSPYSSIKPLSVYAPAIDSGKINWSTLFEDSPYKKVKGDDGKMTDWPQNANGVFSGKKITVSEAVEKSINTVAVKSLSDFGVGNSIDFLKKSFNLNLDYEIQKLELSGDDEVIGNLAMGYLYKGLSPVQMSGFYQIFANGGKYYKPETIRKLTDSSGKVIYENKSEPKQVIKESTAFIMNKMLQRVVNDGTATDAQLIDADAGGKTGTGNANDAHWFVGFVPQYTCAIWHGGGEAKNLSPALFGSVFSRIELNQSASYPKCKDVSELVYCLDSGKKITKSCNKIDIGYYSADSLPESCKIHK